VNTPQIVSPYNGSTSWTSFRDHFKRVATVNRWEDDTTRAQHLMLALEGTAAKVLKEINDTSPTVYQDIWKALSRRFGEVDEVRESMRKFENRKQLDSESVVEYELALRNLYRLAWPKATPEQKDMALKTRFEEGLSYSDMQQYLRLHAMSDTFENTVEKARRFAASIKAPKTKRSVRITTPPSHESVQMISDDDPLMQRMDRIENMIRSLQVNSNNTDTTSSDTAVKCVNSREPRQQFQASRAKGNGPNNSKRRQTNRKQFVRPFDDAIVTETETNTPNRADYAQPSARQSPYPRGYNGQDNLVRAGGMTTNVPPPRPCGQCWICRQVGCHSRNHDQRPLTPPPRTRSNICWTCGQQGCRSWLHLEARPPTPPVPSLFDFLQGNGTGTRRTGNRDPAQSARTQ